MGKLFSIGVKNEPSVRFVTDFWDNPLMCHMNSRKLIIEMVSNI
jgi:hypothetical protein